MSTCSFTFDALMNPLIEALKALGGSGTNDEIYEKVSEVANISSEELDILHNPENNSGVTEIEYRLRWAQTYLKKFGILENSNRGVWAFTEKGQKIEHVDQSEVVRFVRKISRKKKTDTEIVVDVENSTDIELPTGVPSWQEELLNIVTNITPAAFERLIQRVLREAGFIQVEVTGRAGDGGIDGHGIMRLGELLGFQVNYQAKRYKGSVGPGEVRDFRGAMVGRADKGILITTGTFTRDAKKEATRDGAPAIDLIDGDQLAEMLKRLSLGVTIKLVEHVTVEKEWFTKL